MCDDVGDSEYMAMRKWEGMLLGGGHSKISRKCVKERWQVRLKDKWRGRLAEIFLKTVESLVRSMKGVQKSSVQDPFYNKPFRDMDNGKEG